MILSDFLSRQKSHNSNSHEIIPISFSLRKVLHESYYRLRNLKNFTDTGMDKYMVQTRAQVKSRGIKLSVDIEPWGFELSVYYLYYPNYCDLYIYCKNIVMIKC